MEILLPEECVKHDVCKFVGDNGCFMGCDFRLEVAQNSTSTLKDLYECRYEPDKLLILIQRMYKKSQST